MQERLKSFFKLLAKIAFVLLAAGIIFVLYLLIRLVMFFAGLS